MLRGRAERRDSRHEGSGSGQLCNDRFEPCGFPPTCCIGVIVAAGASVYLLRAISIPLNKAVDVANHIADGKLENQIVVDSRLFAEAIRLEVLANML
ncbi:methyl-accepting chemotaxis protein [Paraburkholderia sp. UCT70]|uniref:hypothetical protein n=1 Tax=Paraburkholderia sp. UCT70 TaxID=2991068 RepID=UPI003D1C1031